MNTKPGSIPRASLVAAALALAAPAALAADDPRPEFTPYSMSDVTVTADAPRPPSSVTTEITAKDIEATHARTVAEALAAAPGIRVSAGRKDQPNVSIHGFDQSRILVLIDGVPYYESNYGKLDLNQVPTDNVARIEVFKTAPSALYGANALGGVINIVTRAPAAIPSTSLVLEGGTAGSRRVSVSRGEKLGKFGYWVNVARRKTDGWDLSSDFEPRVATIKGGPSAIVLQEKGRRVNSDVDQRTAWAKFGVDLDGGSAYYANLHYLDLDKGAPVATDSAQVTTSRPAFSHFARIPLYRDTGIDLDGRQRVSRDVTFGEKVFYHHHVDDYVSYSDPELTHPIATSGYDDSVSGAALTGELAASRTVKLRAALNLRRDSHDERDDTYLPFARSVSRTESAALEGEWKAPGGTVFVGGLGYDAFRVTESHRNVTAKGSGDFIRQDANPTTSVHALSPVLTANQPIDERTTLFAAIARKTRFPTLSQLYSSKGGNVDLEPEKSTNRSVGVIRLYGQRTRIEASVFDYGVENLISRDGPDRTNVYRNYGEARMTGVEALADTMLAGVTIRLDYTFNRAVERGEGRVTERVVNTPRHRAGWAFSYRVPATLLRLDVDGTYTSEVFTSLPTPSQPTASTRSAGATTVWGARASYDIAAAWEVYVAARNLFDRDYESEPGYPAPGRSIAVGLQASF